MVANDGFERRPGAGCRALDRARGGRSSRAKPRPTSRHVVPKAVPVVSHGKTSALDKATAAPVIQPATRQHAALPPPAKRKPVPEAAMAATSSTSRADLDTLRNVIDLTRKHKPPDATQAEAAITDPVARKLAEWIILRSDDNGASANATAPSSPPIRAGRRRHSCAGAWKLRCGTTIATTPPYWRGSRTSAAVG